MEIKIDHDRMVVTFIPEKEYEVFQLGKFAGGHPNFSMKYSFTVDTKDHMKFLEVEINDFLGIVFK